MTTRTRLPGDGIGPEVTAATVRVLDAAGAEFEWEPHAASTSEFTEAVVREIEAS